MSKFTEMTPDEIFGSIWRTGDKNMPGIYILAEPEFDDHIRPGGILGINPNFPPETQRALCERIVKLHNDHLFNLKKD